MKLSTRIVALSVVLCSLIAGGPPEVDAEAAPQAGVSSKVLSGDVRTEQVKFVTGDLKLAGTIFLPRLAAGKKAPAVLLLSGSDHHSPGAISIARAPVRAFHEIATLLAGSGMVAFSYETRCNGSSECKPEGTPHDYASDAVSAFSYLSSRKEVDPARMIVLGHDEGGVFAAGLVANAQPKNILGLVLVGVPGRTYNKVLRDQAQKRLSQQGKTLAEITAYLSKVDLLVNALSSGAIDLKAANVDANDPLFGQFAKNRHYLFHLFVNDPLQVVRGVDVPVLIVQGERDAQIEVKDAQYLKECLTRQYNPDVTLEVLPFMDHWMRAQKEPVAFRDEEPTTGALDPAFVAVLNTWIETTKVGK